MEARSGTTVPDESSRAEMSRPIEHAENLADDSAEATEVRSGVTAAVESSRAEMNGPNGPVSRAVGDDTSGNPADIQAEAREVRCGVTAAVESARAEMSGPVSRAVEHVTIKRECEDAGGQEEQRFGSASMEGGPLPHMLPRTSTVLLPATRREPAPESGGTNAGTRSPTIYPVTIFESTTGMPPPQKTPGPITPGIGTPASSLNVPPSRMPIQGDNISGLYSPTIPDTTIQQQHTNLPGGSPLMSSPQDLLTNASHNNIHLLVNTPHNRGMTSFRGNCSSDNPPIPGSNAIANPHTSPYFPYGIPPSAHTGSGIPGQTWWPPSNITYPYPQPLRYGAPSLIGTLPVARSIRQVFSLSSYLGYPHPVDSAYQMKNPVFWPRWSHMQDPSGGYVVSGPPKTETPGQGGQNGSNRMLVLGAGVLNPDGQNDINGPLGPGSTLQYPYPLGVPASPNPSIQHQRAAMLHGLLTSSTRGSSRPRVDMSYPTGNPSAATKPQLSLPHGPLAPIGGCYSGPVPHITNDAVTQAPAPVPNNTAQPAFGPPQTDPPLPVATHQCRSGQPSGLGKQPHPVVKASTELPQAGMLMNVSREGDPPSSWRKTHQAARSSRVAGPSNLGLSTQLSHVPLPFAIMRCDNSGHSTSRKSQLSAETPVQPPQAKTKASSGRESSGRRRSSPRREVRSGKGHRSDSGRKRQKSSKRSKRGRPAKKNKSAHPHGMVQPSYCGSDTQPRFLPRLSIPGGGCSSSPSHSTSNRTDIPQIVVLEEDPPWDDGFIPENDDDDEENVTIIIEDVFLERSGEDYQEANVGSGIGEGANLTMMPDEGPEHQTTPSDEEPFLPDEKITASKQHRCELCGDTFKRVADLLRHGTLHNGGENFLCYVCGATFEVDADLKHHIENHEDTRLCQSYTCDQSSNAGRKWGRDGVSCPPDAHNLDGCVQVLRRSHRHQHWGTGYPGGDQGKINRKTPTAHKAPGQRSFRCHVCSGSYTTLRQLDIHQVGHMYEEHRGNNKAPGTEGSPRPELGSRPCQWCGKEFRRVAARAGHHCPVHRCHFCSRTFDTVSSLRRHLKSVDGEGAGAFQCQECGKYFRSEKCLRVHKEHHPVRDYNLYNLCHICGRTSQAFCDCSLYISPRWAEIVVGTGKVEPKEVGAEKVEAEEVRIGEGKASEGGAEKVKSKEAGIEEVKAREVGAEEVEVEEVEAGKMEAEEVGTQEIKAKTVETEKMRAEGTGKRETKNVPRCHICGKRYATYYFVKQHITESHSGLPLHSGKRSKSPHMCSICGKTFPKEYFLKRHQTVHSKDRPYCCRICGKCCKTLIYLRKHVKTHKVGTHQCGICPKIFRSSLSLERHQNVCKDVMVVEGNITGGEHSQSQGATCGEEERLQCDVCGKSFASSRSLRRHQNVHKDDMVVEGIVKGVERSQSQGATCGEEERLQCDVCGKSFASSWSLKRHQNVHKNDMVVEGTVRGVENSQSQGATCGKEGHLQCDMCGKTFSSSWSLRVHSAVHSADKPYQCEVCGKAFKRRTGLNAHKLVHTEVKPHQCESCGKTFKSRNCLQRHRHIHSDDRPYQCATCGKLFKRIGGLQAHKVVHTRGERYFKCDLCGKAFTTSRSLKAHQVAHSEDTPHQCGVCGKGFTWLTGLRLHEEIHQEGSRFECDVCGKAFTRSSSHRAHRLVHSEDMPHRCSVCGKKFKRRDTLRRHEVIHREERPFQCDLCGKAFKHKRSVVFHQRVHEYDGICQCRTCGESFDALKDLARHKKMHSRRRRLNCGRCERVFNGAEELREHICPSDDECDPS